MGAAGVSMAGALLAANGETRKTPLNVLLLHGDQHRADCIGAYGNPDLRTPHLDALAADGIRYANSFCPFPVCTPSRYSLLSGQYVHQHRGWDNHCTLAPDIPTFPRVLKAAGYHTKAVGKMHFTPTYLDVGFDEMCLAEQDGPGRWDDDYHRMLRDAGLIDRNDLEDQRAEYRKEARPGYWETFGALPSNLPEEYHSTRWIADRAIETIEQWTGAGNLLMTGFIKPHHPFDPPVNLCELYDPAKLTLLPGWTPQCFEHDLRASKGYFPHDKLTESSLRRVMAYYYAIIEQMDREIGRIIDTLKKKGLYDDTLIIYTGDHGEYMGFHHLLLKGNHLYDPLMKVPLIAKHPKGEKRGTVNGALVSNVDVAPFILQQTGCPIPAGMTGQGLLENGADRDLIFAEASQGRRAMARSKTQKLLYAPGNDDSLFFDLENDPMEMNNLFDDPSREAEIGALVKAIEAWRPSDALQDTYLDENAPIIRQSNVPSRGDHHREEMIAYTHDKMAAFAQIKTPLDWLNTVYDHAANGNILAALNPKVFFGYFCVCADGQGFGYANSYPSLDGHQLSHALLFLGKKAEVLANWDYVKAHQQPDGHLPIMIDAKGDGLYVHWCPGDPLRALGPVTYAHNAYAIYAHTLDAAWLRANLPSVNLAMEYLASLITPDGRVGGAGFYVEMPTRIEWDGVSQCYAVDALERVASLNVQAGDQAAQNRWSELAARIRTNFQREFWRTDHCVEYIHPERGPIDRHGLTDVDWAALATGLLPEEEDHRLWLRLKDEPRFRYGGMPTGISTAPDTYEDWEFIPAEQFPKHDRRHDLAAMGRVWYLASWARARHGDITGLLGDMRAVAEVGALHNYSWQERYFPSTGELRPGGPMTYCEYPANLVRIMNQFVFGVEPQADGMLRIAPQVPAEWWNEGWSTSLRIGDGILTLSGERGLLKGAWRDIAPRRLRILPPPGAAWKEGRFEPFKQADIAQQSAECGVPPETPVAFELYFT